jgi:flagellar motility protein MotE (MotC chaperone)
MNRPHSHSALIVISVLALQSIASAGFGLEAKKPDPAPHVQETRAALPAAPDSKPPMSEIQKFCSNNIATAGDAKVAWQAAKLKELEEQVKQRIGELDAKRAEYEEWLRKRNEAMRKAEDGIVAIYARMRPEAAASQLSAMDDEMAAALLTKLSPRNASAILNEIEPGRAARLTNSMVGANTASSGKKS